MKRTIEQSRTFFNVHRTKSRGECREVVLFHRFEGYEENQKDMRSKALFLDTNDENVIIWCAGALFDRNLHKPFHISSEMTENSFAIGVHCFCEEDERIVALRRNENDRC